MRAAQIVLSALLVATSPILQTPAAVAQSRTVEIEVIRYTVRPGDTVSSIARTAGVAVAQLMKLNPDVDSRFLRAGQTIYLPANATVVGRPSLTLDGYRGRLDDEVALRGSGFTPRSNIRVMVGESPYRLEAIDAVRADRRGRVEVAVDLPEWARPGQQLYFVLQNRNGKERAVADAYQIVRRQGRPERNRIEVFGTLTRQGVECPTMRGDDGRTYSLLGDLRGYRPGDRIRVEGAVAEVSICQQGTALQIRDLSPAD